MLAWDKRHGPAPYTTRLTGPWGCIPRCFLAAVQRYGCIDQLVLRGLSGGGKEDSWGENVVRRARPSVHSVDPDGPRVTWARAWARARRRRWRAGVRGRTAGLDRAEDILAHFPWHNLPP